PVLYLRKDEKSAWAPATEWVELSSTKAAVPFFPGGDLVIASVAPSFFDVQEASPAYSWVKEPIAALAGVGVIKGISPTQFGLDRTITRTEFVTLLERINGEAFQIQLPSRPDGSKLVPNEPISRMEMGYLLAQNAQDWATSGENSLSWKDAANIPEWVRTAISQVTSHGWLRGRTDGRFDPQAKMTRAEAVTVLYRYWKDKHNREKE
ncbi:S-layer homology domain-containing protein, partial [Frankia sp. Cpl3]|nr:S-layer homology domain-containing protein [Frankia sp. Cpl3]